MGSLLVMSKSIGNSNEQKAHEEPGYKLMVYYKLYSLSGTYLLVLIAINTRREKITAILLLDVKDVRPHITFHTYQDTGPWLHCRLLENKVIFNLVCQVTSKRY